MDISVLLGSVVTSMCGRDEGKRFAVIEIIDADYVYIADGRLRRVESPKRKKIKHVRLSGDTKINVENITNKQLREYLSEQDA